MSAASPWAGLAGSNPPPAWNGARRVCALLSERDEPADSPNRRRAAAVSRARQLHLVVISAAGCMAVLLPDLQAGPRTRCVPWALVRPGTEVERELLTRAEISWPLLHG